MDAYVWFERKTFLMRDQFNTVVIVSSIQRVLLYSKYVTNR